jgi:hypothetical protein
MPYAIKGSRMEANEAVLAQSPGDAWAEFARLAEEGFIVTITDVETGAEVHEMEIYDLWTGSDA